VSWWGKLVGGAFGFMLGGPLGALFGAAVGHGFDRGLMHEDADAGSGAGGAARDQERVQAAFFTATFSVLGHLAKVDGRVHEEEIALAREVMRQMALSPAQERAARALFAQGKRADFDLGAVLGQLRRECGRRHALLQMFLEIQLHAAYADGALHAAETRALGGIARDLGFSAAELAHLEALVKAQRRHQGGGAERTRRPANALAEAYKVLGVSATAGDEEVKRAYRRLMNQHHPDKLVAKGLPEEMMRVATARTQEIKIAYETVKAARVAGRT
jgi:DnaJ like chaperone protein